MRILLAIDGSANSLRAAQFLVALMKERANVAVHVLNVQPPIPYLSLLPADRQALVEAWHRESGLEASAAACDVLKTAALGYDVEVVAGDPAQTIAQFARDHRCDLIVMGTRGMGTITGLVLGSVASKVVQLADPPVTLVK